MKALRVTDLPVGDWIYELKFDGYRALAFKAGKEVRLISRNRTNFDNDYPQLIDAFKSLALRNRRLSTGRSPRLTIKADLLSNFFNPTGRRNKSRSSITLSICSSLTEQICVLDP